jgi:hypothetical protein
MPFNRATRNWIYRHSKNKGGLVGFGSTMDLREPGTPFDYFPAMPWHPRQSRKRPLKRPKTPRKMSL